jgi:orotidine-5'-phosphate decarboxylase
MMKEAKASLSDLARPPKLIAVTVLTSMAPEDLVETGAMGTPVERAVTLAELTRASGLDGVVCSAQEAPAIRERLGEDFSLITPGIRLQDDALGDQRRVLAPREAIAAGANYLVVGRPITAAEDPAKALVRVLASIAGN